MTYDPENTVLRRRLLELELAGALVATLPSTGRRMTDFRCVLRGRPIDAEPVQPTDAFEAMTILMHARGLDAGAMTAVISRVRLGKPQLAAGTLPGELIGRWLLSDVFRESAS